MNREDIDLEEEATLTAVRDVDLRDMPFVDYPEVIPAGSVFTIQGRRLAFALVADGLAKWVSH